MPSSWIGMCENACSTSSYVLGAFRTGLPCTIWHKAGRRCIALANCSHGGSSLLMCFGICIQHHLWLAIHIPMAKWATRDPK
jgi:hypothetical protein